MSPTSIQRTIRGRNSCRRISGCSRRRAPACETSLRPAPPRLMRPVRRRKEEGRCRHGSDTVKDQVMDEEPSIRRRLAAILAADIEPDKAKRAITRLTHLVPNISAADLEGDFVYCRREDRSRLAMVSVPEGCRGRRPRRSGTSRRAAPLENAFYVVYPPTRVELPGRSAASE